LLSFCDIRHFKEFFLCLCFFSHLLLIFLYSICLLFLSACQFTESSVGKSKIYLCECLFQTWKQNVWFASLEQKILYKDSRLAYFWTLILTFTHPRPPPLTHTHTFASQRIFSHFLCSVHKCIHTPLDVNTSAGLSAWNSGSTVIYYAFFHSVMSYGIIFWVDLVA